MGPFRDWLRAATAQRDEYAAAQAGRARPDRDLNDYSDDKMPWISAGLARAETWGARTGWNP